MTADVETVGMRPRTVLVTGATAGIGFQTARALAGPDTRLIITGRDHLRGHHAAEAISAGLGSPVTFLPADHGTVGGNLDLADRVAATVTKLDVLVNNVGGLYGTRWETADGYEATLAMNFVGPVALTLRLLPLLRASTPARCVNVVSASFAMYKRDPFDDLQSTRGYLPAEAYARAKLLSLLAALTLADRVAADGITVNAVHPGMAWTDMTRSMTSRTMPAVRYVWPLLRFVQRYRSPVPAGRRVAALAAADAMAGHTGGYYEKGLSPRRLSIRERDVNNRQRAWRLATDLISGARTGTGSGPPSAANPRGLDLAGAAPPTPAGTASWEEIRP
jgi:NAD(P)-dependent dehydrogenase (short-subunit alcohol dehydrogenase family)